MECGSRVYRSEAEVDDATALAPGGAGEFATDLGNSPTSVAPKMKYTVRPYIDSDRAEWLRMRIALRPDHSSEELAEEMEWWPAQPDTDIFVADAGDGPLIGFAEVAIHAEAPGCTTDRIGFLEGWYVDPAYRRQGIGRALNAAAEQWARERGCTEMASDTNEQYPISPSAHVGIGYSRVSEFDFAKRLT